MKRVRMSLHTALVLLEIRRRFPNAVYGMELLRTCALPAGTVYPILHRLSEYGWLDYIWEQMDPSIEGRPPRRYYSLTSLGMQSTANLHTLPVLRALTAIEAHASTSLGEHQTRCSSERVWRLETMRLSQAK